jgi:hypothetical protein
VAGRRAGQKAIPPSTGRVAPVMNALSFGAGNPTALRHRA